jgi:hypothetical protein
VKYPTVEECTKHGVLVANETGEALFGGTFSPW